MKYLKLIGLSALAALALTALVGAGTSSATVLCASETAPCTSKYGIGTEIKAQLKEGTIAKLHAGFTEIQCKKSRVVAKTENSGGASETVNIPIETLTFEECNCEVVVLKKGRRQIHYIEGTHNGTDTGMESEITVRCPVFGVDCVYGTGAGTDLGVFQGGKGGFEAESVTVPRISGSTFCAKEAQATANYEVTTPKPAYVAQS